MRIQQLPPFIANQIAAGEVIERPASIVKELLENALDAQADSIHVDIGFGGLNQVKISDNGIGIVDQDLLLAVASHATSKIKHLEDLSSILSMGFRGEALSSIASISRLTISSKPAEQAQAMMLRVEGEQLQLLPCARNQGTTVDVRDIFYNAPVRKKFLKNERSEFQFIESVVKRFALTAFPISIRLTHNGKQHLLLPSAQCDKTMMLRVSKILGKPFIDQAIHLDVEHAGMKLHGWIGSKEYQRSQNDRQWIYVNGRMVKDKLLNHAIKQAYESIIYPGRHPACLLYLTISPQEIDVNVHPTKHEIRFQQPQLVHAFLVKYIQQALAIPSTGYNHSSPKEHAVEMEIKETYIPLKFSNSKQEQPMSLKHWIHLNTCYAIIFIRNQPFLIDCIRLQQAWLLELLLNESLPLKSRPVLVPIKYTLSDLDEHRRIHYQCLLSQIGIETESMHGMLWIRSLPLLAPQLKIESLLTELFESNPSCVSDLCHSLVCHQEFEEQVSKEKQEILFTYLDSQYDSLQEKPWSKHLSEGVCRALLSV